MSASRIYLIEAENGLVKIGHAQKVSDRLATTRAHSPVLTRLIAQWLGGAAEERAMHERFGAYRNHGEWFRAEGEFADFITEARGLNVDHIPQWDDLRFSNRGEFLAERRLAGQRRERARRPRGTVLASDIRLGLTKAQSRALAFIRTYASAHGFSPSYQDIADGLGLASKSGVRRYLHALVERGHIKLITGAARCIEVVDPTPTAPAPSERLRA